MCERTFYEVCVRTASFGLVCTLSAPRAQSYEKVCVEGYLYGMRTTGADLSEYVSVRLIKRCALNGRRGSIAVDAETLLSERKSAF